VNSSNRLMEASQGEGRRQTEVEVTGATMQGAVDVPRLDTFTTKELACGGKVAVLILKRESGLLGEPSKPLLRIGNERQDALIGRDDYHGAIKPNLDEWQSARTLSGRHCALRRTLDTSRRYRRHSRRGSGWRGSFRGNKRGYGRRLVGEALAQERQGQFGELSLQSSHLLTQETEFLVQIVVVLPRAARLSNSFFSCVRL